MPRTIIYHPPSPDVIEHFAHSVCFELGGSYLEPEIEEGLAGFLKVISRAVAKDLNRKQSSELDNRIE
ncbi:hypothetical protein [Aggregatilinea lenta]|uniref:hypothetical protein n=1 Tax=Aggregatilinea lenta TaxID=913108 RepID=UPI000E5C12B1|nr:hypothetical protein [Aggregatilinea lenta]